MPSSRLTAKQTNELLRRYAEGHTAAALAADFGVAAATVRSLATRRGVRSRRHSAPTPAQREFVLSLHSAGTTSPTALGRAAGLSRWSVLRVLRRAGAVPAANTTDRTAG